MSLPDRWVVLKFGGTSVATRERWETIGKVAQDRLAENMRPLVVCSAVSGVTDLLLAALDAALRGEQEPILAKVQEAHRRLAEAMGVDPGPALGLLDEVRRLLLGASLTQEITPR